MAFSAWQLEESADQWQIEESISLWILEESTGTEDRSKPYIAITRRTTDQMRPKQRMAKPARGLFK